MPVYHELFTHAQNDVQHRAVSTTTTSGFRSSITEVVEEGIEQGSSARLTPNGWAS